MAVIGAALKPFEEKRAEEAHQREVEREVEREERAKKRAIEREEHSKKRAIKRAKSRGRGLEIDF